MSAMDRNPKLNCIEMEIRQHYRLLVGFVLGAKVQTCVDIADVDNSPPSPLSHSETGPQYWANNTLHLFLSIIFATVVGTKLLDYMVSIS